MYKLCLEPLDPRDPFFFFYIIQQNFTGGARGRAITLHFCVQMFTMGGSKWHNTERGVIEQKVSWFCQFLSLLES
jgi:hypothetical protein